MPSGLVSTLTPGVAFQSTNVWHDDLNPDVGLGDAMQTVGLTGDAVGSNGYVITATDAYAQGQVFALDVPLATSATTDPDSGCQLYATDIDAFMALEVGGDFEGVLTAGMMQMDPSWSIPRYVMTGTTLDCDTSAPLSGSTIILHDSLTGLNKYQGTSDGLGVYNLPAFEPGPYLVRAVNGAKTAISLPVVADAL
jgi:hypothetical protein